MLNNSSGLLVVSVQALPPHKTSLQSLKLWIFGTSLLFFSSDVVGGQWGCQGEEGWKRWQ